MSRQSEFRSAILDPARPVPDGLLDGAGNPAGARFSVYRNNVAVSLTEALEQTFPVVRKLIGEENFKAVAGVYLRAHPPTSPILSTYGDSFPGFLETFEPLLHLGYLPDTARLEQAMVRSYHAADATPLDPSVFSDIAAEDLPGLRLTFAPSVRLLRSPWPIHGIWRFNTQADAPQPPHQAQDILITRPEYDPVPRLLASGAAAFISALGRGAALGDAAENATREADDFDLSALLSILLADRALTGAQLQEKL
jgi:hypothetical protein